MTGTVSPGPAEVAPADADRAREHARIRAAYRHYDSSAQEQRKRDEANPGVHATRTPGGRRSLVPCRRWP